VLSSEVEAETQGSQRGTWRLSTPDVVLEEVWLVLLESICHEASGQI
jgi:hypothetical protein